MNWLLSVLVAVSCVVAIVAQAPDENSTAARRARLKAALQEEWEYRLRTNPELATAVRCIVDAAGVAVLAHPHRYRVSNGVLRELVEDFKAAGGSGLEVSLAGMGPGDADRAAALARRFDLAGSIGSDFHEPGLPWRPLGRFAKLPDRIMPIMDRLGL